MTLAPSACLERSQTRLCHPVISVERDSLRQKAAALAAVHVKQGSTLVSEVQRPAVNAHLARSRQARTTANVLFVLETRPPSPWVLLLPWTVHALPACTNQVTVCIAARRAHKV